jgi:hypothetical protein
MGTLISFHHTTVLAPPSPHLHVSRDGTVAAFAGRHNTVVVLSTSTGAILCTYYGHQEGVYKLTGDRVTDLHFDYASPTSLPTAIISTSSTSAIHRWNLRGIHLATIRPAARIAALRKKGTTAVC